MREINAKILKGEIEERYDDGAVMRSCVDLECDLQWSDQRESDQWGL